MATRSSGHPRPRRMRPRPCAGRKESPVHTCRPRARGPSLTSSPLPSPTSPQSRPPSSVSPGPLLRPFACLTVCVTTPASPHGSPSDPLVMSPAVALLHKRRVTSVSHSERARLAPKATLSLSGRLPRRAFTACPPSPESSPAHSCPAQPRVTLLLRVGPRQRGTCHLCVCLPR